MVLCRFMWGIKCLSFFLVPSRSSNTPLYPQSAASQRTCPNSLLFRWFHFKTHIWSLTRSLGVCCLSCLVLPWLTYTSMHKPRVSIHGAYIKIPIISSGFWFESFGNFVITIERISPLGWMWIKGLIYWWKDRYHHFQWSHYH